jgi:hypothetical protein
MTKFQFQDTPEGSPYVVPSIIAGCDKTRLSVEGFRFWCFLPGEEHADFGLTEEEMEIWDKDPVLSGSNHGQEWTNGPAYLYVTARKLVRENHNPDSVAMRELMQGLDDYELPGDPVAFPDFKEADSFNTEFFVYAELAIRTLIFETFRDNFNELLAEAEAILILEEQPEVPYKNQGLEGF